MFCALIGQDSRWAFTGPLVIWFRNMSLLVRIFVFWVFDQDTDMHASLQGLGRLLNLDIETRDIVLYKKQTKKMKRTTKV